MDQYQVPLAKLTVKAPFLALLPLTAQVKIQALYTWVYPMLRHIAVIFFPTPAVIKRANMAMRIALGIRKLGNVHPPLEDAMV